MKKILLTLFLLVGVVYPQDGQNYISGDNSTETTLDSSATFTGTWELVSPDYSAVTVITYASHVSGTNGLSMQFSDDKDSADVIRTFTVSATNTTVVYTIPVVGRYYRTVYTTSIDSLTVFDLKTIYHSNYIPATNAEGEQKVILGDNSGVDIGDVGISGSPNQFTTGFAATVGTVADTLTFGFTSKEITMIDDGSITDTLYVSTSASFPSGSTYALVGDESLTIPLAATVLYVKGGDLYVISRKYRIFVN